MLHLCLLPPGPSRNHHPSNCRTGGTAAKPGPPGKQDSPTLVGADCAVDVLCLAAVSGDWARPPANRLPLALLGCGAVAHLHRHHQYRRQCRNCLAWPIAWHGHRMESAQSGMHAYRSGLGLPWAGVLHMVPWHCLVLAEAPLAVM